MAVVKINAIEVPEGGGPELERRFAARLGAIDGTPGFLGFKLLRPVAGDARWFVYTRWETDEAFAAWTEGSGREAHSGERARPVGTGSALLEFEVVQSVGPAAAARVAAAAAAAASEDQDVPGRTDGGARPGPVGRHDADPTTSGSADTAGVSVGVI